MPKTKILLFLIIFLIYFFLSIPYYSGDIKNHLVWGQSIATDGTFGFYSRYFHDYAFPNYPPLAMVSFFLSFEAYQLIKPIIWFLNNAIPIFPSNIIPVIESLNFQIAILKMPALISAIVIGVYIFYFSKKLIFSLLFLINPAILYITVVWGQIDLLPLVFLLPAFYFLIERKWIIATILISLMLLSKQTSLVFYFIFIALFFRLLGIKKLFFSGVLTFIILYVFYLPFLGLNPSDMINLYIANFEYVAKVTQVNAINLWGYLYDFHSTSDARIFNNMTYNLWGYLLFAVFLLPLLGYILRIKKTLEKKNLYYKSFYILFITSIIYYLTLTRMHERYIIPSVVFAMFLIIFKPYHFFNLAFFTIFSFLNLYRGLEMPDWNILRKMVFSVQFLGTLFISYLGVSVYNISLFIFSVRKPGSLRTRMKEAAGKNFPKDTTDF